MRCLAIHVAAVVALGMMSATAGAQGMPQLEEMKKRMEEISRLMRESEKLLLEITRIDRLVAQQDEVVRKLKELGPVDPAADAATRAELEKRRDELREMQARIARQLEEMLESQRQNAERSVAELEKLLQQWPRMQGQGQDPRERQRQRQRQKDRERQLRNERQEKKQRDAQQPRDPRDLFKDKKKSDARKPADSTGSAALRRIEAWIARLPPEQQERLNRGDFSAIPAPYRRLVREYTILRAKREAEEAAGR